MTPETNESIVVIGSNGLEHIVYGLGATEKEALEEAVEYMEPTDEYDLQFAKVSAERAEAIRAGDIDANDLWDRNSVWTVDAA